MPRERVIRAAAFASIGARGGTAEAILHIFGATLPLAANGRVDGLCRGLADGRVGNAVSPRFHMAGNLAAECGIRIGRQSEVIPAKKLVPVAEVIQRIVRLQIMCGGLARVGIDQPDFFR